MADKSANNRVRINTNDIDSIDIDYSGRNKDVEREITIPSQAVEFEFGFDGESSGRMGIELESDLPGFENGEYRMCRYCDGDSFVHADHFEDHLQDKHNITP